MFGQTYCTLFQLTAGDESREQMPRGRELHRANSPSSCDEGDIVACDALKSELPVASHAAARACVDVPDARA